MPVLAVSKPESLKVNSIDRNWAVTAITAVQGALISPIVAMTGIKQAAGSGEKWSKMITDNI
jgi:hypothetical protein